jgi:CDP-diacylglycerol---serine O-phosphatidyltransferase
LPESMTDETEQKVVHKGFKKGLYLLPSTFTAANIAMGFLAVIWSVRGFQIVADNPQRASVYFDYAAVAIGLAILFDTLDGRVARMTKTTTEIGVQLDSFADVLTFGIAPIVLGYTWGIGAVFNEQNQVHGLGVFVLFMYVMCGAFRLARFNLQALRPRVLKEGSAHVDKKNFVGLPIPPAAGLLASIIHFNPMPLNIYAETGQYYAVLIMLLMAVLGFLMISTLRYSSFKSAGTSRSSIYLIIGLAAFAMAVWLYSRYVLLILSLVYVSHGVIWYLITLLRPSKQLEPTQPQESQTMG